MLGLYRALYRGFTVKHFHEQLGTRWLEALPEATRDTATGEALQAIADLDLDEILAIRPPRGFGRD
jgi:hypothetical protein